MLDLQPDVVLMDLRMPHVDGIEATRRIVAAGSPTRVLVLTTFEGEELTFRALQAGAAGYLLKDAGGARLVSAVEAVAAGERPLAPEVVARLVASYVDRPPGGADATRAGSIRSATGSATCSRSSGPAGRTRRSRRSCSSPCRR